MGKEEGRHSNPHDTNPVDVNPEIDSRNWRRPVNGDEPFSNIPLDPDHGSLAEEPLPFSSIDALTSRFSDETRLARAISQSASGAGEESQIIDPESNTTMVFVDTDRTKEFKDLISGNLHNLESAKDLDEFIRILQAMERTGLKVVNVNYFSQIIGVVLSQLNIEIAELRDPSKISLLSNIKEALELYKQIQQFDIASYLNIVIGFKAVIDVKRARQKVISEKEIQFMFKAYDLPLKVAKNPFEAVKLEFFDLGEVLKKLVIAYIKSKNS